MKTKILSYLIGGLAIVPATMGWAQKTNQKSDVARKPNILLVLCDDMGKECLGTYGGSYSTPSLDRLAERGVKFNYGFSQPLCTPTRVQLMTGMYNYKNYSRFELLNQDQFTFANLAKQAGYKTVMAGKWQLGQNEQLPAHFGFDQYCLWNLNFKKKGQERERYSKPLIEQDGKLLNTFTDDDYGPDVFRDYLIRFMEQNKNSKQPLFMYYSMVLVHDPFLPTPDSKIWKDSIAARHIPKNENFRDMCMYADKEVGQLLQKLEELKMLDNTIIIFMGDNGTARYMKVPMKDGSFVQGGKGMTVDAGVRVPLIAYWAKAKYAKHTTDDLIDCSDVFPTLADAMRVKIPDCLKTDGRSFLPVIEGKSNPHPREMVFVHYDPVHIPGVNKFAARFFRDHRYKLYSDGRFFDCETDPKELNAIPQGAGSPDAETARSKMQKELDKMPLWKFGDRTVPEVVYPEFKLRVEKGGEDTGD